MADDWYRSSDWYSKAIEDFELRLKRSRGYNRPQYLRIKALALLGVGLVDEGRMLLQRIVEEYPDSLFWASAQENLGDVARSKGHLKDAERAYRHLLAERPDLNATSGEVRLSLAEVLLERSGQDAVNEVRLLLRASEPDIRWNSTLFRALLLSARAAELAGDSELQVSESLRALSLVDADPQISHKPSIGGPRPSDSELAILRRLARSGGDDERF